MRNKFILTITDINGSRHYMLRHIVKKFLFYFVLLILASLVLGGWYISYLSKEVSELERKKDVLVDRQRLLSTDNEKLKQKIVDKTYRLETIQDKVSNIEEMVGLKPTENIPLDDRLANISLSSNQQQTLLQFVPNGPVVPMDRITGKFGWRTHPILKKKEFHRGIDIRAAMKTPITAPADGVVEYAGYHKSSGFGYLIIIDHNYGFKTSYGHLSKKMNIKAGQFVKKGDVIGYTGNSGLSTGPHLHYEVRFIARPLNPINFIKWERSNFDEIFEKEKRVSWQSLVKMTTEKSQTQKPLL